MITQELSMENADRLMFQPQADHLSLSQWNTLIQEHTEKAAPPLSAVDPRTGTLTLFNPDREKRPHDNRPDSVKSACPVCSGNTTPIVQRALLSTGFTFINLNLFPISVPQLTAAPDASSSRPGIHLLQWTSSIHDQKWYTLTPEDRATVIRELGTIEKSLLQLPFTDSQEERHVSIIKNQGSSVGGSLEHDHQQIALLDFEPPTAAADRQFFEATGRHFSSRLLETNLPELTLKTWDSGELIIPPFMSRPYNMVYVPFSDSEGLVHNLSGTQIKDLGNAMAHAVLLMEKVLKWHRRDTAYNIVFHTSKTGGFYVEFLPFSQPEGGFEKMGISICQSSPQLAAERLKVLQNIGKQDETEN